MAINRFTQRQAAQFDPYTPPLDVLQGALQMKQAQYEKYYALADELGQTKMNALDPDRARANTIIRGYNDRIEKVAQEYGGDYSRMGKDLLSLTRQIKRDFSPGGEAHAIEYNYSDYQKWLERQQELLKKGSIKASQLNAGSKYLLSNYTGIGEFDAQTGRFNRIGLEEINPYVDINELVTEYGEPIISNALEQVGWTLSEDGRVWVKNKVGVEEVSRERVMKVLSQGIMSNRGYMDYAQQMDRFGAPIDPAEVEMALNRGMDTFAFRKEERDVDFKYDKKWLIDYEDDMERQRDMIRRRNALRIPEGAGRGELRGNQLYRPDDYVDPRRVTSTMDKYGYGPGTEEFSKVMDQELYRGRTLTEAVNDPRIQEFYGPNLKRSYDALEQSYPQWNSLPEDKKADLVAENYNSMQNAIKGIAEDILITPNAQTQNKWTDQIIKNQMYNVGTSITYVDKDNRTHANLTPNEALRKAKLSHEDFVENGRVHSKTVPTYDLTAGYVVNHPNGKGYFIIHGIDGVEEEASKAITALTSPLREIGEGKEAPIVPLPGLTPYDENGRPALFFQMEANPIFDEQGRFKSLDSEIKAMAPIRDQNGQIQSYQHVPYPFKLTMDHVTKGYEKYTEQGFVQHKSMNSVNY
jgi:hypothetical protein